MSRDNLSFSNRINYLQNKLFTEYKIRSFTECKNSLFISIQFDILKDFDQSRKKLLSISLVAIRQWIVARLEKIARNCIIRYLQRDPLFQVVSLISLKITKIRDWIKKEPNSTLLLHSQRRRIRKKYSRQFSREWITDCHESSEICDKHEAKFRGKANKRLTD